MEGETIIPEQEGSAAVKDESTVMAVPANCPVCGTESAPAAEWCEECGFFLGSEPEAIAAQVAFARLVDAASGAEYPLKDGENAVGRGSCDVVLAADKSVSRSHAKVVVEPPNIYLEDSGSTNGTFLNGEKIGAGQRVQIGNGDQVKFAGTILEVVAPEAAEPEMRPSRQPAATLEMVGEDGTTRSFRVFRGENSLGRHPSNDVPLGFDGYASGRHARITVSEEGIFLEDLGSTNGTELNGRRLTTGVKEPLSPGDQIKIGETLLKFAAEEEGSAPVGTEEKGEETSVEGS